MTIRGVLWDMDGTLIDSEPTAVKALFQAAAHAGLHLPEAVGTTVIGMAADNIYSWFKRDFGLNLPENEWEALKHQFYFQKADEIEPFHEAVNAWRKLDDAHIRQAVVSNSARSIVEFNCKHLGIAGPDLVTISRDDVKRGKPSPEGYLRAAGALGLVADECVIIEDSASGIQSGLAAKITTYVVPYGNSRNTKHIRAIKDFTHFAEQIVGQIR